MSSRAFFPLTNTCSVSNTINWATPAGAATEFFKAVDVTSSVQTFKRYGSHSPSHRSSERNHTRSALQRPAHQVPMMQTNLPSDPINISGMGLPTLSLFVTSGSDVIDDVLPADTGEGQMKIPVPTYIQKKLLGAEHPDALTSMGNLASTYRNQGRWNEAEQLYLGIQPVSLLPAIGR